MNAPVAKDQFEFTLGNVSYIDSTFEDAPALPVEEPRRGVRQWIADRVTAVVEWRHRQEVMREMELMTDHELADIGLTRSDLQRVFDPEFALNHAHGRDYIAY